MHSCYGFVHNVRRFNMKWTKNVPSNDVKLQLMNENGRRKQLSHLSSLIIPFDGDVPAESFATRVISNIPNAMTVARMVAVPAVMAALAKEKVRRSMVKIN